MYYFYIMTPRENSSTPDAAKKTKTQAERNQEYISSLDKNKILSTISVSSKSVLRPWEKGKDVQNIKDALNYLGFPVWRGDTFDDKMTSVVMSFQENRRILADGIVGPRTIQKLVEVLQNRERRDNNTKTIDIPTAKPEIRRANGITFEIWNLQKKGKPTWRQVVRTSSGYLYQADFDNRWVFSTGMIFLPDGSVFEGAQRPHNPEQLYGTYTYGNPRMKFKGVLSNNSMKPIEGTLYDKDDRPTHTYKNGRPSPLMPKK